MTVPTVTFNDDREMPQLGLGTYKLYDEECIRVIREAIDLGYRHFDTATVSYTHLTLPTICSV